MNKGDQTRQRIVAAAAPLFNQHGFAGASVSDILAAAGIEKGCLYRHFESKEALAAEAFRYALATSTRTRALPPEPGQQALPHLIALLDRFVEAPSGIPGGCPLLNTAIDADDTNPTLRGLALEGLLAWRKRLVVILKRAIASGELQPETDPRQLANTLIATLEGALMISRLQGTRQALHDARTSLVHLLNAYKSVAPKARHRANTRRI